jgi:arylsulfatase A
MPNQPNVILILADDMGYGDLGVLGDGSARTPALDRLVGEGVLLTQHYSGSAVCAPARAALLTGRYPHRTGAIDTFEGRGLDRLALREATLADHLKAAGYATGLIGKWHLGALDPRYHPNARGFAEFAGFRGGWSDYYQWRLDYNGAIQKTDGRYLTDVFSAEAINFVRRHRQQPFFLHLAYNAPHTPLQAPEEAIRPFREAGFSEPLATLYGMIARMDDGIGRLLDEVDRLGLAENTIVLFTSDNGPQFGSPAGPRSLERYNAHFNGQKTLVYEGGIRVPAIVRWPVRLAAGERNNALLHFTDWLPTLLAAVGQRTAAGRPLDGGDILPVLQGDSRDTITRRCWQWNRYTPVVTSNAAIRDGDWKLLRPALREAMRVAPEDGAMDRRLKYEPEGITDIDRTPEPPRTLPKPPAPLLFNIAEDPFEQHDLAAAQPQRAATLLRSLETWFEAVEAERATIQE